jgi:hypothetical protein
LRGLGSSSVGAANRSGVFFDFEAVFRGFISASSSDAIFFVALEREAVRRTGAFVAAERSSFVEPVARRREIAARGLAAIRRYLPNFAGAAACEWIGQSRRSRVSHFPRYTEMMPEKRRAVNG